MSKSRLSLRSVGEDELITLLTSGLVVGSDTLVGAGDDCAVIGKAGQRMPCTLFKTDCIVEGVHFLPDVDPAKVGWKAMARAVSDLAAMGGRPTAALATIVLHPDTPLAFVRGLYRGFQRAAVKFDFGIVGGETSQAPVAGSNMVSVSMIGKVEARKYVLRSTAKAGDEVFVTGRLGGSINGRHLSFEPRLEQARWLVKNVKPTAMMDVSDGIAKDLPRLATASNVGYSIEREKIPRRRGCTVDQALTDGEDYELLLTFSPRQRKKLEAEWQKQFPRLPLTRIGVLTASTSANKIDSGGWDHFR